MELKAKMIPVIHLTLKKPTAGWWNGGIKSSGEFHPQLNSDGTIHWGSYEMNYFIKIKAGKTWEQSAAKAQKVLEKNCKVSCSTEVKWIAKE